MSIRIGSAFNHIMVICLLSLMVGCSHSLTVKNIDAYQASGTTLTQPATIGVTPTYKNESDRLIIEGVTDNLRKYANIVSPYYKNSPQKVDVVIDINLSSQYEGSGVNFLITWPGFLLFIPALNGYVYTIDHNFRIDIQDGNTQNNIDSFAVPVSLNIRHADMSRTAWAEAGGWLAPGMSAVAFVSGLFHIKYDPDVTPLEAGAVKEPIGNYVAREIINRLNTRSLPNPQSSERKVKITETNLNDKLEQLKQMRDKQLITEDDYNKKKSNLLEQY